MASLVRISNNQHSILKEYCNDIISHNGKYYYEQNKTAKGILQISNATLENKLKYIPTEHRIVKESKTYLSHDVVIRNLTETNQLFVIPLLEKLNFIERKTVNKTTKLGSIPFSRIVKHDMMKTINENGNHVKGLRDELLFLDSIVYTLKHLGLDWKGNLDFQCTKLVDGYRYDLYIKCSKICIEYNEYKSHHTCDLGISHDDEKTRITNSEGYLLLNFDQTKKGDDSKQSTLVFISDLLPIVKRRRHLYDFETDDIELYLDYLESNGINKNHAKLMQDIAIHKDNFTLTLENAMVLMRMDTNDNSDIEIVLNLIIKLSDDIWKCEIDGKLNNDFSNLTIYNGRLNHRGFVKVAILINTDFSHEILDYYMKMDELPNQRLEFWDKKHFMKPYDGKMLMSGNFELSRGCMHKCHYCFNRYMQIGFDKEQVGAYRRNKSVDTIIREVLEQHKKYNFEIINFSDDNFLGRSFKQMEEFYERWEKEVNIPYWINTCIETLNEKNVPLLKKSKCAGIGIGMETGSEWVRRNILLKGNMTNQMYIDGFKLMAKHGIRSTCNVMIGFPGEYEEDVFENERQ